MEKKLDYDLNVLAGKDGGGDAPSDLDPSLKKKIADAAKDIDNWWHCTGGSKSKCLVCVA